MTKLTQSENHRKSHRRYSCWGCARWFNADEAIPFPGRNSPNLNYCPRCIDVIRRADEEVHG